MNKPNFRPKRSTARKALSYGHTQMNAAERALEFGSSYGNAYMRLDNRLFSFDPHNGTWLNGLSMRNSHLNLY